MSQAVQMGSKVHALNGPVTTEVEIPVCTPMGPVDLLGTGYNTGTQAVP